MKRETTKQRWLHLHQALGITVPLLSLLPFGHLGLRASGVPALSCADLVEFLPSKTTQHKRALTFFVSNSANTRGTYNITEF